MSQAFRNVNVGKLADAAFAQTNADMAEYTKKYNKVQKGKLLETQLGTLKLTMSGKKIAETAVKKLKPIVKNTVKKGWNQFKNKWNEKANNNLRNSLKEKQTANQADRDQDLVDADDTVKETEATSNEAEEALANAKIDNDALPEEHALNEEGRQLDEDDAQDAVDDATGDAIEAGKSGADLDAATQESVQNQISLQASNDAARAAETQTVQDSEANVAGLQADADTASAAKEAATEAKGTLEGVQKVAETSETAEIAAVPEVESAAEIAGTVATDAAENVGIAVDEDVGVELDETGVLAPIGLVLGALGIALGSREKGDPKLPQNMAQNQENYSFQVGVGM